MSKAQKELIIKLIDALERISHMAPDELEMNAKAVAEEALVDGFAYLRFCEEMSDDFYSG